MDISNINPDISSKYNSILNAVNKFIYKNEITIAALARYLGVKKRDTVYAYLDGTHIIPLDKYLLLVELTKRIKLS